MTSVSIEAATRMKLLLLLVIATVQAAQSRQVYRTVADVFDNIDKDYNKNVPPPTDGGNPVMVGITVREYKK
jgi:hypothetical protein